jgi:hypothetical protein
MLDTQKEKIAAESRGTDAHRVHERGGFAGEIHQESAPCLEYSKIVIRTHLGSWSKLVQRLQPKDHGLGIGHLQLYPSKCFKLLYGAETENRPHDLPEIPKVEAVVFSA